MNQYRMQSLNILCSQPVRKDMFALYKKWRLLVSGTASLVFCKRSIWSSTCLRGKVSINLIIFLTVSESKNKAFPYKDTEYVTDDNIATSHIFFNKTGASIWFCHKLSGFTLILLFQKKYSKLNPNARLPKAWYYFKTSFNKGSQLSLSQLSSCSLG